MKLLPSVQASNSTQAQDLTCVWVYFKLSGSIVRDEWGGHGCVANGLALVALLRSILETVRKIRNRIDLTECSKNDHEGIAVDCGYLHGVTAPYTHPELPVQDELQSKQRHGG